MKIIIKSEEHRIKLAIPHRLLTSRFGLQLLARFLSKASSQKELMEGQDDASPAKNKAGWKPNPEQLEVLRQCLISTKKKYGSMPLLEIDTEEGESVRIIL